MTLPEPGPLKLAVMTAPPAAAKESLRPPLAPGTWPKVPTSADPATFSRRRDAAVGSTVVSSVAPTRRWPSFCRAVKACMTEASNGVLLPAALVMPAATVSIPVPLKLARGEPSGL